ncbi:hypothetical protein SLA2020_302860 [Shorea laevis]
MVAQVNLDAVASLRGSISSFQEQASRKNIVSSVAVPYNLRKPFNLKMSVSSPLKINYHSPEEEIALGLAVDSSVAAIVGCMCQLVVKEIANGDEQVKADAIRNGNYSDGQFPTDGREFAMRIFYTVYMGSDNSSEATKMRAKTLADEIGSWHLDVCIDSVVSALLSLFQTLTGKRPRYKVKEGLKAHFLFLF